MNNTSPRGHRMSVFRLGFTETGHVAEHRCLYPGCARLPQTRGLCRSHYVISRDLINKGEALEDDLVERSLLLPKEEKQELDYTIFRFDSDVVGQASFPGACLHPLCNTKARHRGLCQAHSAIAKNAIKLECASEENLISRNLLLPAAPNTVEVLRDMHGKGDDGDPEICVFPGCDTKPYSRGLCRNHYSSARRALNAGVTTEQSLMERGLLLRAVSPTEVTPKRAYHVKKKRLETSKFRIGFSDVGEDISITKCIYPGCVSRRSVKGLCWGHYNYARDLLRDRKANYADLVNRKLLLPEE